MKKVLGLAVLATFFTTPATAGGTFVFNQWKSQQGRTEVLYNIDSTTYSTNHDNYNSSANKMYIDGKVETEENNGRITKSFEGVTVHNAGSELNGSYYEQNTTRVWGTIHTITNSYTNSHETSAGIR